ncbi:SH3 domain-containing protein [Ancylobacter sp. A5.8]|uniref:SH3 domain-containing protein n=1 Tax=Ancylobacter gelatini TaxID=2919920 RepID=UPI001F4E567A|nr:SH3 domain-containing protein [Ancylobacter gelatini]MCJ8145088.1 SH3 domain-containing protein [Ancylobacter gelatini]
MKSLLAGAALVAVLGSAAAAQDSGYANANVNLRAGPSTAYPVVTVLEAGTSLDIFGCLDEYTWCDVEWRGYRGWVSSRYLDFDYRGRRVAMPDYAPQIGVPIVAFSFGNYWNNYYRGRSWYSTYDRWGPPPPRRYPPPGGPGWNGPPPGGPGWNGPPPGGPGWGGGPGGPGWNGPPPGGGNWGNQGRPPQGNWGNNNRPPQGGWNGGNNPPPQGGNWNGGNNRPPQQGGQGGRPPQQGGPPPQQGGQGGRPPQGGPPPQQGGQGGGRPPQQAQPQYPYPVPPEGQPLPPDQRSPVSRNRAKD